MDSTAEEPETKGAGGARRGALSCALLGAGYYLVALFAGGLIGFIAHSLVGWLSGREPESSYYLEYEGPPLVIELSLLGFVLGVWAGLRSYKPAATVAGGKPPRIPFFTNAVMRSRRGDLALLGVYAVPRWNVLIGNSPTPWRMFPAVMTAIVLAAALALPIFLGRDADFRLSIWICAGLALVIADCLLVNKVSGWRATGQIKPL